MKNTLAILPFALLGLLTSCVKQNHGHERRLMILDSANLLTNDQKDSITQLIATLERTIGSQIAVITIPSLEGETIESFSHETFESMRLGRESHLDGLLITVALADRMTRIEVGTGLENIVRDEIAGRLIREVINPHFRNEQFGAGLYSVVDSISNLIVARKDLVGTKPTW